MPLVKIAPAGPRVIEDSCRLRPGLPELSGFRAAVIRHRAQLKSALVRTGSWRGHAPIPSLTLLVLRSCRMRIGRMFAERRTGGAGLADAGKMSEEPLSQAGHCYTVTQDLLFARARVHAIRSRH